MDFHSKSNKKALYFFGSRYSDGQSISKSKPKPNSTFFVMRQKRYKRRKAVSSVNLPLSNSVANYYKELGVKKGTLITDPKTKEISYKANPILLNNTQLINDSANDGTIKYRLFRKNKVNEDKNNINLSRRMLRVKRTLVLPAHVNITAVTNSYDVIHS
jgi:hypothetical protein